MENNFKWEIRNEKMEQRQWRKLRIRFLVIMISCCWIRQQIFVTIMILSEVDVV